VEAGVWIPLVSNLNAREFEGRPPETVMFMSMNKGVRGHFADLVFAERPVSFNKFQHPDTGNWEHIVSTETGETFFPHRVADFSPLTDSRLEVR
jgi:hypothetical protein